jgi:hypothetical protein
LRSVAFAVTSISRIGAMASTSTVFKWLKAAIDASIQARIGASEPVE